MITKEYQRIYRSAFHKFLREAPEGCYDECALPSYAHRNLFISWLFWKRVATALSLAGDGKNKSVLDFGAGGGVTFKWLHDRGWHITACENQFAELTKTMAERLNVPIALCENLDQLEGKQFDVIYALDVLEHAGITDLNALIDRFLDLSHARTKIIISGPTESLLYRAGRHLIGYAKKKHCHVRTIYDIERAFRVKGLKNVVMKKLLFPFTLFRVSAWMKS